MKQWSMESSRRGNSLEGSKFILLQAVGEIQSIDPQPEVSAFGARARSSPSSVDRRSLSFSSISSTLQSSRRHLGFSLAREPLLFFGIRGVECVRSSASWPGYGGECEECHKTYEAVRFLHDLNSETIIMATSQPWSQILLPTYHVIIQANYQRVLPIMTHWKTAWKITPTVNHNNQA